MSVSQESAPSPPVSTPVGARADGADAPHVVIVGGGFGGLYCAVGLRRAPVRITVIDRTNHHLFQPLLYQVASAGLNPSDIASPIRHVLSRQRNARVVLGEVRAIDTASRTLRVDEGELRYDALVLAVGSTHSYFGNDHWRAHAPGLKTLEEAVAIRERFLMAFERAEREIDPARRRAELTFVVIGGGPTGVEMAGQMAEIARRAVARDFRAIDTTTARVILIEGGPRVLGAFPDELSRRAKSDLERLGVEVWLNTRVSGVDERGVSIGEERIVTRNVVWAAGVRAAPVLATLGAPMDQSGRVKVRDDLSIPGHPEVFVIGDAAHLVDGRTGAPVPGVAPAAMQMGRHVARTLRREARSRRFDDEQARTARAPFRYVDKGNLATIGRASAVGTIGRLKLAGFVAWALWLGIHIAYLIGFRNRVLVMIQWAWAYWTFERGARIIVKRGE